MLASGVQQRDIATHVHVSILSQAPFPSSLPHNIEQSSLCIYYFRITLPFMKLDNVWHFCHLNQISLIFTDLQYETSILILVPAAHSVTTIYSSFATSFIHYFLCPYFLPSSVIDYSGQQLPKKKTQSLPSNSSEMSEEDKSTIASSVKCDDMNTGLFGNK